VTRTILQGRNRISSGYLTHALMFLALSLLSAARAGAQQSDCADCHFTNPTAPGHLYEWDSSPHGQHKVGCEKCHGGDASTFDSAQAHREILDSHNPASPVNRKNIPKTCGSCHTGPFVAFQSSAHYGLLRDGNQDVPVCTTCHSDVAGQLLSPRALEARCKQCHKMGGVGGHPELPVQARNLLEQIHEVRDLLKQTQPVIAHVQDRAIRDRLQEEYHQAEVPLIESVTFGHSFAFASSQQRREVARRRTEALLKELDIPAGATQ
jgi:hypothetical protein